MHIIDYLSSWWRQREVVRVRVLILHLLGRLVEGGVTGGARSSQLAKRLLKRPTAISRAAVRMRRGLAGRLRKRSIKLRCALQSWRTSEGRGTLFTQGGWM